LGGVMTSMVETVFIVDGCGKRVRFGAFVAVLFAGGGTCTDCGC
jgi:hypothetical protein